MISTTNRLDRFSDRAIAEELDRPTLIAPFISHLNWMAIAWREDKLVASVFGYPSRRLAELALARIPGMPDSFGRAAIDGRSDDVPQWAVRLAENLRRFAEGEPFDFVEVPLSLDHLTTFGARVIAVCRRIPWGQL